MSSTERHSASRYIDAPPVQDCPTAEGPPIYDHYPAGYNTVEGKVDPDRGIDNPQADEVAVVADPFESDYAEIPEASIAVDDRYSPVPTAEEPPIESATEKQVKQCWRVHIQRLLDPHY